MAKFKKRIVTAGVHKVGRLNGNEEKDAITPARIKSWVENTKKLKELGVLIPAPLAHQDKNKKFAFPVIAGKDGETLADAYSGANQDIPPSWDLANLNAGFWEDFSQDKDGTLVGEVDIPNDETAQKLGNTIKETSVLVMPGRRIVDKAGNEHEVGEHLAHVALCLHPQENGQANFEPLDPLPASLAMSFVMPALVMDDLSGTGMGTGSGVGMDAGGGLPNPNAPKDPELYTVISLLRSAKNLALPEDTTRENFLTVLKIVLTQALASDRENQKDESVTMRPEDAQTKSPSIAMSQTVNTPAPNKVEALLMSQLIGGKRKDLKARVAKLVASGRIAKSYADKTLYPKIEAFSMSASDLSDTGEFPKTAIEELLDGLEESTPLVGESLVDQDLGYQDFPEGAVREEIPQDVITGSAVQDLSDAQSDAILNEVF